MVCIQLTIHNSQFKFMCGIAGFLSFVENNSFFDKKLLIAMTTALAHRGPDAAGYFFEDNYHSDSQNNNQNDNNHAICGLGHRRLSILDLSEIANQPMYAQNERYVMIFNGEVFNYQEIRQELPTNILQNLKTSSDSEIILELFSLMGNACVQLFNGMFVMVIYDKQMQKTTIFRDRMGVKPLYYFYDNKSDKKSFAFASELKSLQKMPLKHEIDRSAVADFLHLGYIPAPKSIYKNIFKMPTASILEIDKNGLNIQNYWNIFDKIDTKNNNNQTNFLYQDENIAKAELKRLLQSSVGYRLIADVPVGVFLSGGIDSSLVAALSAEHAQAHNSPQMKTFSIGFTENGVENKFNEAQFAAKVAKFLHTDHHEFMVSTKEAKNLIPTLTDIYDEPYADSSAVPTLLVSALARKHVTVALGGDGGDELFLGYGMYDWAKRLQNPLLKPFKGIISKILQLKKTTAFQKASSLFGGDFENFSNKNNANFEEMLHIFSQEQFYFSKKEIKDILKLKNVVSDVNNDVFNDNLSNNLAKINPPEFRQSVFDMCSYLPDDLLVKVDRATMKYALEARVPLLDYRVVEFALQLSPKLKYKNGERKYLLKQLLYDYVPKSYFERPKQGFSIPLIKWLRTDLRFLMEDFLSEKVIKTYDFVDFAEVEKMKKAYLGGNDYYYNRLWTLIVLHQFLTKI